MWEKKYSGSFDTEVDPPVVEVIHKTIVSEFSFGEADVQVFGWIPPEGDSAQPFIEIKCKDAPLDLNRVDEIVLNLTNKKE